MRRWTGQCVRGSKRGRASLASATRSGIALIMKGGAWGLGNTREKEAHVQSEAPDRLKRHDPSPYPNNTNTLRRAQPSRTPPNVSSAATGEGEEQEQA